MASVQNKRENNFKGKGFKPGQSGNPGGRPKTADFAAEVRKFLKETDPAKKTQDRLRRILINLQDNKPEVLLHYAFGKPIEQVDITGSLQHSVSPETVAAAREAWKTL